MSYFKSKAAAVVILPEKGNHSSDYWQSGQSAEILMFVSLGSSV